MQLKALAMEYASQALKDEEGRGGGEKEEERENERERRRRRRSSEGIFYEGRVRQLYLWGSKKEGMKANIMYGLHTMEFERPKLGKVLPSDGAARDKWGE